MSTCPRCKKDYTGYPALSRRDNKTDICSDCGTEEALIDAGMMPSTPAEIDFLKRLKEKNGAKMWR